MIYDLVDGNETFDIVAYRKPRKGDLYIAGPNAITAFGIPGSYKHPKLIVELREKPSNVIRVAVNVAPAEEVLSSLAGKLERAAAELRS